VPAEVEKPAFQRVRLDAMIAIMSNTGLASTRMPVLLLVASALVAMTALAFAGWVKFGPEIILTMMETGASWCL